MESRESALFMGIAIPAGIGAIGVTTSLAWIHRETLASRGFDIALLALLAVLSSWPTVRSQERGASVDLSYILAAALALPFPAPLLVALAGSLGRLQRGGVASPGALRRMAVVGAGVSVDTVLAASASGAAAILARMAPASRLSPPHLPLSLLAAIVLFAIMIGLRTILTLLGSASPGDAATQNAEPILGSTIPLEAAAIPLGWLMAAALAQASAGGSAALVLLGTIAAFANRLLADLDRSEQRIGRLKEDLDARGSELAALNAVGRELASHPGPERILQIVTRECVRLFQPDLFAIATVEPESGEVRVAYTLGDAGARVATIPQGQGVTAHVLETQKPLVIADAPRELKLLSVRPIVVEPRIRSIVVVPLLVQGRAIGALSVQSFRNRAYGPRDVSLLTTIGEQAALALGSARQQRTATVDLLTGLHQRDHFFERLSEEHRRASRYGMPFSILMLDLDSFKRINERFGHMAGDHFLRSAGAALGTVLRSSDVPCRYGGEEFCILLPETDLAAARIIAERIRSEIGALRVSEGPHRLGTTVSIGVATFPVHYEGDLPGLVRKAERALDSAKRQGKDRVILAA